MDFLLCSTRIILSILCF
uniref:Uncharacterized protein n=1 Tax=Arundo donax TaxID=35708 RepID=A0A0A8YRZ0_ARUDO